MKQRNLILFLFMAFCQHCFSQSKLDTDSLANELHFLSQKVALENIYLQTSKGIYESGEDLWFKAYVLDAQSFIPSTLSQTLYLQLISESTNKALWQEKYKIQNGFADGQVYLPDSLSEGNYLLEGFSAHSFYAGKGQFTALRRVWIVKNYKSITASAALAAPEKKKTDIQFNVFPEGGKLISDLPAVLAFKAVNANGQPLNVSGVFYQDGKTLQEFKSEHVGMGSLKFTPIAGKNYYIKLIAPATDSIFSLPKIYPSGISLSFTGSDSTNLIFSVKSTGGKVVKVYLRGQLRGQTACIASGTLKNKLTIKLPLKEFQQQGIAEFTLFDENMLPVAERLVYVNPKKKLYIKAELSKQPLGLREKASIKIKVSGENGLPIVAHLGVSVFDKLYQNVKEPKNILTHYLLTSQLKGKIFDPAYYFDEKNKQREQALDLLLLTQGWRNYVWCAEKLGENLTDAKPFLLDGIAGEVRLTKRLKQAPNTKAQFLMAFSPDEKGNAKARTIITADTLGKFIVGAEVFQAGWGNYIYLKPISLQDYSPRLSLSTPFSAINKWMGVKELIYPLAHANIKIKTESPKFYETRLMSQKLNEVVVKAKGSSVFRDKYLGKLDSMTKAELNTDFVCLDNHNVPLLNCFGQFCNKFKRRKPIEGEFVVVCHGKDGQILGEDYSEDYYYGNSTIQYHNPYLNFTEKEILERHNLTMIKSYYAQKEFYQPNYDKQPEGDGLPDTRNTLLWAPNVITDNKGEASLSFFSSDINTAFVGKIEGVSGDGFLGLGEFEFKVLKTSTP